MLSPYLEPIIASNVNMDAEKLDHIIHLFRKQQQKGAFAGGQMVVRRFGKIVIKESVGIARPQFREQTQPYYVQDRTPFPVYSSGKPLAAIAIAILEDRGLLDIKAPICEILPEFSAQGKEQISTLDVMTHCAGIIIPGSYSLVPEKKLTWKTIVKTKPLYPRGTFAYMPIEYGVILTEITQKISGKSLVEFVREEIALPLNAPALHYGLGDRNFNTVAYSSWYGDHPVKIYDTVIAENIEESINAETCFNSMNPAYNMITDAASLAVFYEFLLNKGCNAAGKQLISAKILQSYITQSVAGWNKTLKVPIAMGRGFTLGSWFPSSYGWWNSKTCFGHGGMFSSLAFGEHKTQLAVAIVTNGNRSMFDFYKRFIPLTHGLRNACN